MHRRSIFAACAALLLLGACTTDGDGTRSEGLRGGALGPSHCREGHPGQGPRDHAPAWGHRTRCDASIEVDGGPPPECEAGETRECTTGMPGRCAPGLQACTAGSWGACAPTAMLTPEVCNGLDDECNGVVDDEVFDDGMDHSKCPAFP